MSWREEEPSGDQTVNGVHSVMPQVSTIMDNSQEPPNKRKRGRPPIDDYDQTFTSPKITSVTGNVQTDDNFSTNDVTNSDADASAWEDEQMNDNTDTEQKFQPDPVSLLTPHRLLPKLIIIVTPGGLRRRPYPGRSIGG